MNNSSRQENNDRSSKSCPFSTNHAPQTTSWISQVCGDGAEIIGSKQDRAEPRQVTLGKHWLRREVAFEKEVTERLRIKEDAMTRRFTEEQETQRLELRLKHAHTNRETRSVICQDA